MNDEQRNHPGYDIQSVVPGDGDNLDQLRFIEVKGRIEGSESVTVSNVFWQKMWAAGEEPSSGYAQNA